MTDLMLAPLDDQATIEYELLREVYVALGNDALMLAAMGIRALIETVMIAKAGDAGSFRGNLEALRAAGLLSNLDVEHLSGVLELGHAVIHRSHRPDRQQLVTALDIAETLVKRLILDGRSIEDLRSSVPPRTRRT